MASLPILLLGSTGSIGTQTLDLVRRHPDRLRVVGLCANRSVQELLAQVREFRPTFVAMGDPAAAEALRPDLPPGTTLFAGPDAALELLAAADYEVVVHGMVGAAGLRPSEAVLERGKRLALANKESLVLAGQELLECARRHSAEILPVDSEHSAIHQCLRGEQTREVHRILITASGGPFRGRRRSELEHVTKEMALKHPTWEMGQRITIGSATLMNKALEVIELHHLFGLPAERIEVVVHPQSVVHSMVEFVDRSVIAQMGKPDMRGPIQFALFSPERLENPALVGFDWETFSTLTFEPPDREAFPALDLGFECIRAGGTSGAVLNAADEEAVHAFLAGHIPFLAIADLCREALANRPAGTATIEGVLAADAWARDFVRQRVQPPASRTTP
ncbi:MAG: 1-deoxy-D-xylulose-5-phosphate reductoisomerase [Planctomycetota bacterium]